MKKTLLILFTLVCISNISGQIDKQKLNDAYHFYAGAIIAGIVTNKTYLKTENFGKSYLAGFVAGTVAGLLKEVVYDNLMKQGVPSVKDGGLTTWGANCGALATDCYNDFKKSRREAKIYKSKHILD